MRLELEQVSRVPSWPLWAVVVVAVWLAAVATVEAINSLQGTEIRVCLFRKLTGYPCPSCGMTRAALALLSGRPLAAVGYNPFFVIAGAVLAGVLVLRLAFGRALRLNLSRAEQLAAMILFVLLVLANWVYVLVFLGR